MSKRISKEHVVCPREVYDALDRVRNDADETTWIVIGYSDDVNLSVVATGVGGLDAAKTHMNDSSEAYALIRYRHKVEVANTTKYAFVAWIPEYLNPARKAILSTHKPKVRTFLEPHHVTLEVTDESELDENEIMKKIGFASGTAIYEISDEKASTVPHFGRANSSIPHVVRKAAYKPSARPSIRFVPKASTSSRIKFEDETSLMEALKAVRSDHDETSWCLAGLTKNVLGLNNTGTGDVTELLENLSNNSIQFGLIRIVQQIDRSKTTKFVFFYFQPASVNPMARARGGTIKPAIAELFQPYHLDFFVDDPDEISQSIVDDKVAEVSGQKLHVTDRASTPGLHLL